MRGVGRLRPPQGPLLLSGWSAAVILTVAMAGCAQPPFGVAAYRPEDKLMWRADLEKLPPGTPFDQLPAPLEVAEVYPPRARAEELEGRVYLRCTVREDRRPHDCTVLQEPHEGVGFGAAALKLAARYRFAPGDLVPPYPVVIPIYFRLSE